jgi:hypothetical protein
MLDGTLLAFADEILIIEETLDEMKEVLTVVQKS